MNRLAALDGWARRRRSGLFDLMVAGIVAVLVLPFGIPGLGAPALLGLGMAVAVIWRRRFPLAVMAVVSTLALLQVLLFTPENDPRPYDIAVLIAMYSVVKYGRHRWHGLLAAVPVVIGIVIEVTRHYDSQGPGAMRGWLQSFAFLFAICAAVWLTAYTLRVRRLFVAGLEERAATAERERDHLATIAVASERATIARELHDVVAHSLAVMIVQADGAGYALDQDPEQARMAIKQVATTGRDALEDMRRLVGVLRGGAEEPDDAVDRRRPGLDQLDALVDRARSAGLVVNVSEQGERGPIPPTVELTVFRIFQEALTNVLRHAGPQARVDLSLRYRPGAVRVEVTDDGGRGPAPGRTGVAGHGLVGMRERVAVHDGQFTAGPRLRGGWHVTAEVPCP